MKMLVGGLSLTTVGLLIATIVLGTSQDSGCDNNASGAVEDAPSSSVPDTGDGAAAAAFSFMDLKASSNFFVPEDNTCHDANPKLAKFDCDTLAVPQTGANVTKGFIGDIDMGDVVPTTVPFQASGMCPVNIHWHLGTEHISAGEYDENGVGPHGNRARPEWANRDLSEADDRGLSDSEVRDGFRCNYYDAEDPKFTTPYDWKYCSGMEVGETYEVHWPHSSQAACGTPDQYQEPFYDGAFCNLSMEQLGTLSKQDIADNMGVQAQVYTVVNDEDYYYANLFSGMIVDKEFSKDMAYYTGSTTGTSHDNEICSAYGPITWHVDRKCHLISASTFDKMCFDMKMQRDDMEIDTHPHGSRELVNDAYVANNQVYTGDRKNLRA